MSRLLLLAGSPPLQALEARSYSAYDGCVSLDTSTASTIYNLDQSDPPTCASTCGDEYQYVAIQAQFCFCFPSPPVVFTTHNDSDCSINCDYPYQDESCGGVTPGTLIDVYSFYAGSDLAQPGTPSDDGNASSGISSLTVSQQASSPSEQAGTSIKPTTIIEPSPVTPGPTAVVTNGALPPTGTAETDGAATSEANTGIPGIGISVVTPSGPKPTATGGEAATVTPGAPTPISPSIPGGSLYTNFPGPTTAAPAAAATQLVSTFTITLWTTVTSFTTVYPGGALHSTIVSMPMATTCITAKFFTSSCSEVTVTSTCAEDGSVVTTVLPGSVHVVPYNPYVSEARELVVEGTGAAATTRTVLAAVVEDRGVGPAPSEETPMGTWTVTVEADGVPLTTAGPELRGAWVGSTGWGVTASGSQIVNASDTLSQVPVTAKAARAGLGWQDSMMITLLFAVVLGAIW